MIRTLGFLTGIVVTGTALALLTDPGVVRPALDSLAGSIRQPGNEQIATQAPTQAPTQAQAQKGPAAGILPPARLMQRPDSPIEAADATTEAHAQNDPVADTERASADRAGEDKASTKPANDLPANNGPVQKQSAVSASAAALIAKSDTADAGNEIGHEPGNEHTDREMTSSSDSAQANPATLPSVDMLAQSDDLPEPVRARGQQQIRLEGDADSDLADGVARDVTSEMAGEMAGELAAGPGAEEPATGTTPDADGNWFAFWTPFRSRASADGFARHLNERTGQDIQVLRLGPGEYRVAFFHQGEQERQRHLAQLESASGLRMGGEL